MYQQIEYKTEFYPRRKQTLRSDRENEPSSRPLSTEKASYLGLAGGAAGVENKEGILCVQPLRFTLFCRVSHRLVPPHVTPGVPGCLRASEQQGTIRRYCDISSYFVPYRLTEIHHVCFELKVICEEDVFWHMWIVE